jgi:hypothetical protein
MKNILFLFPFLTRCSFYVAEDCSYLQYQNEFDTYGFAYNSENNLQQISVDNPSFSFEVNSYDTIKSITFVLSNQWALHPVVFAVIKEQFEYPVTYADHYEGYEYWHQFVVNTNINIGTIILYGTDESYSLKIDRVTLVKTYCY